MFFYEQLTGKMWHRTKNKDGKDVDNLIGTGYSGATGITKNNPDYQDIHDEGPIPQGFWQIQGPPIDTSSHGPFVLHLFPETNTNTFGRSGFLIHGDSVRAPGNASQGCVILPLSVRQAIWAIAGQGSDNNQLRVIDKFSDPSDTKDEKGDLV